MLKIRPYRKNDAQEIVKWCMDETSFYKWNAGIMGSFPLTPERLEEALCGRIDNDRYFRFWQLMTARWLVFSFCASRAIVMKSCALVL